MASQHLPTPAEIPFNTYTMKKPLVGTVVSTEIATAAHRAPGVETRHIVIKSPGLKYLSGQSIGVIPPGINPRNNRPNVLRLYSVASCGRGDDRRGDTVSVIVARHYWDNEETGEKQVPGVCSHYLCDAKVGDELQLTGPVGKRFLLPVDFAERDFVFLATGTGVAPFRGMLADLLESGYEKTVTLVLGVPYADSILYDAEFQALVAKHPNFKYVVAVSRGEDKNQYSDLFPTRGDKVYAHIAMWDQRDVIGPSLMKDNTAVYMCGLKGMEVGLHEVMNKMGQTYGNVEDLVAKLGDEGRLLEEVY